MRALASSDRYSFNFYGSHEEHEGIKVFTGNEHISVYPLRFRTFGKIWRLSGYWRAVLDPRIKGLIVHAHPYMPAAWAMIVVAKLMRKKTIFWAHGWLKHEPLLRRKIRSLFYSQADAVLTYATRAIAVAQAEGYTGKNIIPIGNSLDWDKGQAVLSGILTDPDKRTTSFRRLFPNPSLPLIICSARLTSACRFDLLMNAARLCAERGSPFNVLLIGDGPERSALEKLASDHKLNVFFYGACYNEEILGEATYQSDLTVSPGKVGLTAIQSLTYGTPVITHGDLDSQMPEVETIEPGKTGAFFRRDSAQDLAEVIDKWLSAGRDRATVRSDCMKVIQARWNPHAQKRAIEGALDRVFGQSNDTIVGSTPTVRQEC
ncbi:glycosyltransferase family 1 protein [Bradyrhizobium sp. CCGE-LA001]|uniref:glycosyltransferase family 1 protein n=1 Tax=Bradyrhizobium sp. CCGE-LA001 TaxID=1223566 RepID=UPI0011981FF0|nr:glycosyltransferase [Bradyrhizobium sp. CCGE-LA001]